MQFDCRSNYYDFHHGSGANRYQLIDWIAIIE